MEVRPYPGQRTTYWVFVAEHGKGDIVEVILDLRLAAGAPQSPEFTAIRGELDLLSPGSDPVVSSRFLTLDQGPVLW